MVIIPKISPIRFHKNGNNIENGSFLVNTGVPYYQQFRGLARTTVYTDVGPSWENEQPIEPICPEKEVILYYEINASGKIVLQLTGNSQIEIIGQDGFTYIKTFKFLSTTEVEIILPFVGGFTLKFTNLRGGCIVSGFIEELQTKNFTYTICGVEYTAKYLGEVPYNFCTEDTQFYAYELNTADHSTDEGIYIMEIDEWESEPIHIIENEQLTRLSYKDSQWRYCAFRNYTYTLWVDSNLSPLPKNESSIQVGQTRNIMLEADKQYLRLYKLNDFAPYYLTEILEMAFNFNIVKVDDIRYTKAEEAEYEKADEFGLLYNFSVQIRLDDSCCEDFGDNQITCLPGEAIVNGVSYPIPSGESVVIEIPTGGPCPEPSGIAYCEPNCGTTQIESFADYDEGWRSQNNKLRTANPAIPTYYQRLDMGAANPLETLVNNNVFGDKRRYTGVSGEAGATPVTGGVLVADHLTKRMYFIADEGVKTWANFLTSQIGTNRGGYGDFYGLTQKEWFYLQSNSNNSIVILGQTITRANNVDGCWTGTTAQTTTENAFFTNNTNYPVGTVVKSSTRGAYIWCRIFDDSTVVGGIGTLS